MAQRLTYDYAVCGLGMAGLAVSAHMSEVLPNNSRVLLLDPRQNYHRDKSWCFWHTDEGLLDQSISHRWSRWLVRWRNRTVVHESSRHPYAHVDSGAYYQHALDYVTRHSGFDVELGQAVSSVLSASGNLQIVAGDRIHSARHVLDSRPLSVPQGTLLQHFHGWEVQCEHPVFDPGTVTLMDFQEPVAGDIHFFYVLPFSHHHALVESTHFSPQVLPSEIYAAEIQCYLQDMGSGAYEVVRRESGVIPMRQHAAKNKHADERIHHIGVSSDTTKASSGYCFAATQRQARKIAGNLIAPSAESWCVERSALGRWFDGVFVRYLKQHPERAPTTFLSLFDNNEPETLIRFMSDRAELSDYVAVARSLPKLPLTKQALAHAIYA